MKCKYCKEEFVKVAPKQKVCVRGRCIKMFSDEVKRRAWVKEKKARLEKLETITDLTKKAQKYCNDYIRARDKDLPCVSCGNELGKKFDAGHYFNSTYSGTRFDVNNIHAQCVTCNHHKSGNLLEYQIGIEKRVGGIELFELHQRAHEKRVYTKEELRSITEMFKEMKKNLIKNLQN